MQMSTLDDFKKSVSEMTNEELMLHIKEGRKKRRTAGSEKKVKTLTSVGSEDKGIKKVKDLTSGMSKEEIQDMIDKITGGVK